MRKKAQEGTRPEAWDWLEEDDTWNPEVREQASRRFFQVWNAIQGTDMENPTPRTAPNLQAKAPLRCTVWRGRVRDFRKILFDLILKQPEGLLAAYERGFEEIYDDLVAQAQNKDYAAQSALEKIDAFLGRGTYRGEGARRHIQTTEQESAGKERGRNIASQRAAVEEFWGKIQHWPALQKKYLDRVVEDVWTDFSKRGGYDTGVSKAGGELRTNRLLTFYLMKDPFPYLTSVPTIKPNEITESNTPETAFEGKALKGAPKTIQEYTVYKPGGLTVYVKNELNPNYDFIRPTAAEIGAGKATVNKIREKVIELQRQSMLGSAYLAANVLEDSPAFEGLPGISLLALGREGTMDLSDHERDVTKLRNGGLFRVPEGGLPEEKKYYPRLLSKKKQRPKAAPAQKSEDSWEYKSRGMFSQSLIEVFGQQASMPDLWFDDHGNNYDSMEDLTAAYAKEAWDAFWPNAKKYIREIVLQDLGPGMATPMPSNIVQMPTSVPEVQEVQEDFQKQEEEPASEEQLPVAARHVIRLVRVAEQLDVQGFHKEADKVDDIIRGIISQLTQ